MKFFITVLLLSLLFFTSLLIGLQNDLIKNRTTLSVDDDIEGRFCGGIAANLPEFQCPAGYFCQLDGDYPDAGGKCTEK